MPKLFRGFFFFSFITVDKSSRYAEIYVHYSQFVVWNPKCSNKFTQAPFVVKFEYIEMDCGERRRGEVRANVQKTIVPTKSGEN